MGRLVVPKLEDGHLPLAVCPNDVLEARWIVVKEGCRTEEMPNELIPLAFTGEESSEEAKGHGPSLSTGDHRARIPDRLTVDYANRDG